MSSHFLCQVLALIQHASFESKCENHKDIYHYLNKLVEFKNRCPGQLNTSVPATAAEFIENLHSKVYFVKKCQRQFELIFKNF